MVIVASYALLAGCVLRVSVHHGDHGALVSLAGCGFGASAFECFSHAWWRMRHRRAALSACSDVAVGVHGLIVVCRCVLSLPSLLASWMCSCGDPPSDVGLDMGGFCQHCERLRRHERASKSSHLI